MVMGESSHWYPLSLGARSEIESDWNGDRVYRVNGALVLMGVTIGCGSTRG